MSTRLHRHQAKSLIKPPLLPFDPNHYNKTTNFKEKLKKLNQIFQEIYDNDKNAQEDLGFLKLELLVYEWVIPDNCDGKKWSKEENEYCSKQRDKGRFILVIWGVFEKIMSIFVDVEILNKRPLPS